MIDEHQLEQQTLEWFAELGYEAVHGPDIAPQSANPERTSYQDVVLMQRLRNALHRLNPTIPAPAIEDALCQLQRLESPSLIQTNRRFHRWLLDGVPVEYRRDNRTVGDRVWLVDFDDPANNDWQVVNQLTIKDAYHERRPDLVVFLNGLPIAVIELKNPADEHADIWKAFNQLQTYKAQIPDLFNSNELLVISDGIEARVGSLTATGERFMPWRTVDGQHPPAAMSALEVLVRGLFAPERLLDYLRYFILFEQNGETVIKKIAAYHQFHAVRAAVAKTLMATAPQGDRRCGVVWHTQGSGKSLTMVFLAAKLIAQRAMKNPTLVVITDRNDLDNQLFTTFSAACELLRQTPEQAVDRKDLQDKLNRRVAGGIIFATIQKFMPEQGKRYPALCQRSNVVVIADEAHRSQYGFLARLDQQRKTMTYGYAQHLRDALPNAGFIGFTGTPVELDDRDTRAVFGDYVDIYDIQQAVDDGATVPIYYENRQAKLILDETARVQLDTQFDEVTEDEEDDRRERLKRKWAALETLVGSKTRLEQIAQDLIQHFKERQRVVKGKGMIVCMSREICVRLYDILVRLRPDWHDEDPDKGALKIIMTGTASDKEHLSRHAHSKAVKDQFAKRFKDPDDPLELVIVRDMWLTGFDAPCLHTLYVDKPMKGHNLMQAIARVNRVFHDKPGGLVVDYLGFAGELQQALQTYKRSGGRGRTTIDIEKALKILQEKLEICRALFHGFDYACYARDALQLLRPAMDHILGLEDGKKRFMDVIMALTKALGLCGTHECALAVREEIAFFQAVKAALVKHTVINGSSRVSTDSALRQIVENSIVCEGVMNILDQDGAEKFNFAVLSDEFLDEVRAMPEKNLAVALLERLLRDQVKSRTRQNLMQSQQFLKLLEQSLNKYQNRGIETIQLIEELIQMAKAMKAAMNRGEDLALSSDELAFYDALEVSDSAVQVLGDDKLRLIAQELTAKVRENVSIDWTVRESMRAKLRTLVRRILRRYGYPPDRAPQAIDTVIKQAELLSAQWVMN